MKHILLIVLCLILPALLSKVSAQDTDPFSYNANIRPSAQAWEMTKYGNLTPSLYTGTFHYSQPLYTYKDPDFEIPVSLEYSFNGFRPDDHSGFEGMGWHLSCGGAVTREVVGLPDDYAYQDVYGFYFLANSAQADSLRAKLQDNNFYFFSSNDYHPYYYGGVSPFVNFGDESHFLLGTSVLISNTPIVGFNEDGLNVGTLYDMSSDIYHFSMPGYSGDFTIGITGEITVFNTSCPEGELVVTANLYGGMFREATVTIETPDGYKYYFGGGRYYSDYSETVVSPQTVQDNAKYCFSALHLRLIEAPNGRIAEFIRGENNGTEFLDYQYIDPGRTVSGINTIATENYSYNQKLFTIIKAIHSYLPQAVDVDSHRIVTLQYETKASQEFCQSAFSPAFRSAYPNFINLESFPDEKRLSGIVIDDYSGQRIDSVSITHTYTSTAIGVSSKMFLASVTGKDGTWYFEYEHAGESDQYPSIDCDETDHWGYWRRTFGTFQFCDSSQVHSQDESLYNVINFHKDPWPDCTRYGALERITYPTGGFSEIFYEQNSVTKRVDINLTTDVERTLHTLEQPFGVGGLRVCKIRNSTDTYGCFRDSVSFVYGGGILHHMPRYVMPLSSSMIEFQNYPAEFYSPLTEKYTISWSSKGLTYSKKNDFIGYSTVSAVHTDGSRTCYEFYDYEEYPDRYLDYDHERTYDKFFGNKIGEGRDASRHFYRFFPFGNDEVRNPALTNTIVEDFYFMRGKQKTVSLFDAADNIIHREQHTYSSIKKGSQRKLFCCYNHFVEDSTIFNTSRLNSVITTDYRSGSPITTTTTYTYNAKGQRVSEQTTSNTLADGYGKRYRYWHEIDSTAPAGNICDVASSRLRGGDEFITGLYHYTYHAVKRTLPVRKTSYHISVPYQTQMPFSLPSGSDSTWTVIAYNTTNHWRPWTISYPDDAYVKYGWDTTGRYILSREENGPANKTYYQWQDMVGLSHITYPTGQGEYYGYDSHNRLCSIDNTWQEPLARYDYHLVNGGDTLTGGTNFIRRTSYLRPAISYKDISYYDGLGYPVQDVALDAGSAGHVVTPKWLDPMRREDARLYLPYPSDVYTFDASAISSQQNWYQNRFGSGETYNYQENRYESSPVGKKISSRLPGEAYRSHPDTTVYRVNSALDSVLALSYNAGSSSTISVGAAYAPAGTLACTAVTDADGHITETFSDAFGHVLLSRSRGDGDKADTYYVRDMKDSLVCVIQPEGSALISRGTTLSLSSSTMPSALSNYAFIYTYDARGRLTAKKSPSLEAEEYTYDDRDRLVTSTDGNLRDNGWKIKYEYDIYDCLIRKSIVNATTGATVAVLAEYAYDRTGYQCTGANAPPVPTALAFEVVDPGITGVFSPATTDRAGTSLGQKYYEKQLILEGGRYVYGYPNYVERAFYYDNLGRLLQSVESNAQGGITRESFNYDLAGNMVSRSISATAGSASMTKLTAFNLDSRGRVTAEHTYLNGATTPTTSVIFTYDVLGRQNAINDGGLVQADHYGLQGWVSHRVSELTAGGNTSSIFSEYLRREGAVYTTPSYTGRIAETFWMHGGQPSGTYSLTYDGFGRLRDGWHYLYGNPVNEWSEKNITYDRNGNVLSLLRYGSSGTAPLNNYTISYEGNRASAINGTDYFEYDFNGNVTGDAARGTAIGYNLLNLPSWFNDGQSDLMVFYDYLADGTKVALHREDTGMGLAWLGDLVFNMEEQVSEPENPEDGSRGARTSTLSKRDTTGKYLKVAKNVNLRGPEEDEEEGAYYSFESTPYAGGRIESIGNDVKVRKFVTDHLGSVRAIVTDNAVVERNDYYPFGGRHDNTTLPTLTTNRYGFIGKERQNISSSLDPYIDFGARFYDPLTARWFSPDPMADKYTSLSQYNYCGADPVNFVDPDGKVVETLWDIANVVIDIKSGIDNLKKGNYLAAATDAGALVLDVAAALIPAIPGGAGTAIKAARGADKVIDAAKAADKAKDASKKIDKASHFNKAIKAKETGSYTITFESGMKYHGKGPQSRMKQSAKQHSIEHKDKAIGFDWAPAASEKDAFMNEAKRIRGDRGVGVKYNNYNKINSPGEKFLRQNGD